MAKKKQWHSEAVEPEVTQPVAEPEPAHVDFFSLSLEEAKAIVNDAVTVRAPGHEADPRPPLELLEQAKAVVNAAVNRG